MQLFAMTVNAIWPLRANGTVRLVVKFRADIVKELVKRENGWVQLLTAMSDGGQGIITAF